MATEVDICNMALSRIGVNAFINALDEATVEASACRVLYPQARGLIQEMYPWPFLTKRATLVEITGGARNGYVYAYALPVDCLRVLDITTPLRNMRANQRIPFKIEHASTGRILLTDLASPEIQYLARETNPTIFPAVFVDAIAWNLAAELALVLPMKENLEGRCRQRFQDALATAAVALLTEGQNDPEPESEIISSRG